MVLGVYFLIAWLFTVLGSIAGWVVADEKIDELPWFYGFLEVGVLILLVLAIGSFVISAIAPLAMGAQEGIGATYPVLVALGVSLAQIFALCFLLLLIDIGKTLHGIKQEHCGTSNRRTSRRAMKLILALAVFTPGFALLGAFSTLDSRLPLWWGLTIGALVGLLFGMIFGGYRARWLDYLFGQKIGHRENSLP